MATSFFLKKFVEKFLQKVVESAINSLFINIKNKLLTRGSGVTKPL